MPATYRAVVEAGLRAGRLPLALEDVADYARSFAELRRVIGQACIYPLMVLLFGYSLFLGFLVFLMPRVREGFESLGVSGSGWARLLERAGETMLYWGPVVPLLVVIAVAAWYWLGRARGLDATRGLRWVPWLGSVMTNWRDSNFAAWLGLLCRHGVPLGDALRLAGRASGDRRLEAWANRAADDVAIGKDVGLSLGQRAVLPPLLQWLLALGIRQGKLGPVLEHASHLYRQRALRQAQALKVMLPTALLVAIGGASALVYILTIFVPWSQLLSSLGSDMP